MWNVIKTIGSIVGILILFGLALVGIFWMMCGNGHNCFI